MRILLFFQFIIFSLSQELDHEQINIIQEVKENDSHLILTIKIVSIIILILLGGIIAGLTLGLMSLTPIHLEILSNSKNQITKDRANKIKPLRKNGHLLLVTLLITNTLINETLPILMDSILKGGYLAIIISTVFILIFGEIVPQAVCSRYGLLIGSIFSYPVRLLIIIMFIFAYPISYLLDKSIGKESNCLYIKEELKVLMDVHGKNNEILKLNEVNIIKSVLDMESKLCYNIMTPLNQVYMLDYNTILTCSVLDDILNVGHSRIPVFKESRNNVIGLLLVKTLIKINVNDKVKIGNLPLYRLSKVQSDLNLLELLNAFKLGTTHMVLVESKEEPNLGNDHIINIDEKSKPKLKNLLIGILTLEDVIEELILETFTSKEKSNDNLELFISPFPTGTKSILKHRSMHCDFNNDLTIINNNQSKSNRVSRDLKKMSIFSSPKVKFDEQVNFKIEKQKSILISEPIKESFNRKVKALSDSNLECDQVLIQSQFTKRVDSLNDNSDINSTPTQSTKGFKIDEADLHLPKIKYNSPFIIIKKNELLNNSEDSNNK